MKHFLLALIWFYQNAISPYWPARCRYVPSCSQYAYELINVVGVWRGCWLILRRLVQCVPWGSLSQDLVSVSAGKPSKPSDLEGSWLY